MRKQTVRFTALACLALALGACEELNVDDDKDHGEDESGDSGGSGGGPSGGDTGDTGDDGDADNDSDTSKPPHVALEKCGGIEGSWRDDGVREFLGIPYAKEPTGDLRWAAPQAPDKWDEDLKATKFARACPQIGDSLPKNEDHAEDCLYLNVWAPSHEERKGLPVMVYFHGGDHQTGSASTRSDDDPLYDGTALAHKGVVVVTINYRLGPLGFLPLGAAPEPKSKHKDAESTAALYGNQGLWDQAFALRWVQDNIEAFGGDADNVTIFGQGSGAVDVCLHVASPESGRDKLFQQAVSQSGGCTTYQRTSKEVLSDLSDWLKKLDCDKSSADEVTKCLRDKSVRDLFAVIPDRATARKWFTPSVDGWFVPDQPRQLFDDGDIADVPYLLGSNANDGSELLSDLTVESEDDYHSELAKLFPLATDEERCEVYPHDAYSSAKKPFATALSHVLGDGVSTCAVLDTALRARDADSDVYAYYFTGVADSDDTAGRGAELKYVFGTGNFSDSEGKLRDLMQSYWSSFASDGYPDGGKDAPEWPKLGSKRKVLSLGKEVSVLTDVRSKQCALWKDVYDAEFKTSTPAKSDAPQDDQDDQDDQDKDS